MCTKASKSHPKRYGEPSCLDHTKCKGQDPPSTCSPIASPYLHMRRQERPSLGSQRVSKHIHGNPILGHTGKRCTQLIMWVSMMQMSVQMRRFPNTLGAIPQRSNSRRRTSATTSKQAITPRDLRRGTNTSTMRSMSWTNTKSSRSMSTIMA